MGKPSSKTMKYNLKIVMERRDIALGFGLLLYLWGDKVENSPEKSTLKASDMGKRYSIIDKYLLCSPSCYKKSQYDWGSNHYVFPVLLRFC